MLSLFRSLESASSLGLKLNNKEAMASEWENEIKARLAKAKAGRDQAWDAGNITLAESTQELIVVLQESLRDERQWQRERQLESAAKDIRLMKEFDFDSSIETSGDLLRCDDAPVLLNRAPLVKRMVSTFVANHRSNSVFSTVLFCHAAGAGKTVLLKLFGRELQKKHGFVVYLFAAPELDKFPLDYFKNLVETLGREGKRVAILVDDVQSNVKSHHWDYLLKASPRNLLVIGAGTSFLSNSPRFLTNYPNLSNPSVGELTGEDMPEVISHFIPMGTADPQWEVKTTALNEIRIATGGQVYPFVVIAKNMFKPENMAHLTNVGAYLTSAAFYGSEEYACVQKRCYDVSRRIKDVLAGLLFEEPTLTHEEEYAYNKGLWTYNSLVSPLLTLQVFRERLASMHTSEFKLDRTDELRPVVEQVITAGLAGMKSSDFDERSFSRRGITERGLAFRWGVRCASALKNQVSLLPAVVTEEQAGQSGAMSAIDFTVTGDDLSLGINVVKDNRSNDAILDVLKRAVKGGVQSHDLYVFNFVLHRTRQDVVQQVEAIPADMRYRVYTFVKSSNALLCGDKVVRKAVIRNKSALSPMHPVGTTRQFSTLAIGALRRLGRFL